VTKPPTCHFDTDRGWLTLEHLRDCVDSTCRGCKPCGDDHCGLRDCPHHVNHEADLWTCPRCIGKAKRDLTTIEDLYALVDTDVELRIGQADYLSLLLDEAAGTGVDSEAFNLVGPAADPGQYAEHRRRLGVAYQQRGWCDWPRHDRFHDDDPHHPYSVLGRWDMMLRDLYGPQTDLFVTVVSAANYLRKLLEGPFPHQDLFELFTRDLTQCREHLEQITHNSRTPEQGRHCPRCIEHRGSGPRLRKRYADHPKLKAGKGCGNPPRSNAYPDGCKTCAGDLDTWHCPDEPEHWWTEHDYRARVAVDYVQHAGELTMSDLPGRTGIKPGTLRRWAGRTYLGTDDNGEALYGPPKLKARGRNADGRKLYRVADVIRLAEGRRADASA
jgi:hypothetical protein